ncbi:hypothetical protein [Sediminimonas sp.]|uniref:hypothetical protein n=1 Tax=Sediminimonas sp. TaxID=2823379 RepID=UPI0025DB32A9|nr:hypothetical protein [Sediminimonas sp.]
MTPYYSERQAWHGAWRPQVTDGPPPERTADGRRHTLRRVQPLPVELRGLPLSEVACEIDAHEAHAARLAVEAETEADGFVTVWPEGL